MSAEQGEREMEDEGAPPPPEPMPSPPQEPSGPQQPTDDQPAALIHYPGVVSFDDSLAEREGVLVSVCRLLLRVRRARRESR